MTMRKTMLSLLLLAAPSLALPAGVTRDRPLAPIYWVSPFFTVANASTPARFVYPHVAGARLVDAIVYQVSAGTTGTSWTLNVRNAAGASVLTTTATITQAAGASIVVDAKAQIAAVAGCTRPVIKTDGTEAITKGGFLDIYTTESGSYSPHPVGVVVLVFQPNG
jgi:hypothetical protein